MRPVGKNGERKLSPLAKQVQSTFKKAMCRASYAGNPAPEKDWSIFKIMPFNATEHSIKWKNPYTRQVEGRVTTQQYFQRKYNLRLQYP
jgi:hypothetical protein